MNGWKYLQSHPQSATSTPDLQQIAGEVWEEINKDCHLNNVILDVQYDDGVIGDRPILAYASRTLFLDGSVWRSGALNSFGHLGSIRIRVNPVVPNGWYVDDGTCQSGYRYDLRTVLRHEIAHGIGVSSSITPDSVGYYYGTECYPTMFDSLVRDESNQSVVSACSHSHTVGTPAYINNIKLYNPPAYNAGSSYSHTDDKGLMWYAIEPMQCVGFDENTMQLLNAIGAQCDIPDVYITMSPSPSPSLPSTSPSPSETPFSNELSQATQDTPFFALYILVFVLVKCL